MHRTPDGKFSLQRLPQAAAMSTLHCNKIKNAPLSGRKVFRLQRPPPDRSALRKTNEKAMRAGVLNSSVVTETPVSAGHAFPIGPRAFH